MVTVRELSGILVWTPVFAAFCWIGWAPECFGASKTEESEGLRATIEYPERVTKGDDIHFVLSIKGISRASTGLYVTIRLSKEELFGQFLANEIVSPGPVQVNKHEKIELKFGPISTFDATPNKTYHFKFHAMENLTDARGANMSMIAEVQVVPDRREWVVISTILLTLAVLFVVNRYIERG